LAEHGPQIALSLNRNSVGRNQWLEPLAHCILAALIRTLIGKLNGRTAMNACPRCGNQLEAGFAHKAVGLSFVASHKLNRWISVDEDLAHSGVKKILPSRAEYFPSYLCRSCELYLIDCGTTIGHAQAKELTKGNTADQGRLMKFARRFTPIWYLGLSLRKSDILAALFALAILGGLVFAAAGWVTLNNGFGSEWDCANPGRGDSVCIKKPTRPPE
jgi:hypothetical protein